MNQTDLVRQLALVVITDERLSEPLGLDNVLLQALKSGAPAIQLRAKEATAREMSAMVRVFLPMVRSFGALLFVNDRLDVALATGADGVHLGPEDLPIKKVRSVVPPNFIIGYSTDDPKEAIRAEKDGADYLGVGTVYPTINKPNAGEVIGLSGLKSVVESVSIPVIAIGGITPKRATEVVGLGARGIAVMGAVMTAPDPGETVRKLLSAFR
tara:strand:+ start:3623 stop:4258 length:636 start_codon:yes stop_codon:yes gene_type:complete